MNKREDSLVTREESRIRGKKFIPSRKGEQYDSLRYEKEFSKIIRSSRSELSSINRYYPTDCIERDVLAQEKMWMSIVNLQHVIFSNGEQWSDYRTGKLLRDLHEIFFQVTTKRNMSRPQFETCSLRAVRGCTHGTSSNEKLLKIAVDDVYQSFDRLSREAFDWRLFLFFFHVTLFPAKTVSDQLLSAFTMIGDKSSCIDLHDLGLVLFPLVRADAVPDMLSLMDDAWVQAKTSAMDENLESTSISVKMFQKMLRQNCFQRYFLHSDANWGRGRMFPVLLYQWEEKLYNITLLKLVRKSRREQSIIEKLNRDRRGTKLGVWTQWYEHARYQRLLRTSFEQVNLRIELSRKHRGLLAFLHTSVRQYAALHIQRIRRGIIGRNIARQCCTISSSATKIQTHIRMFIAQKQLRCHSSKYTWAVLEVQRYIRGTLGRRLAFTRLMNFVNQEHLKNTKEFKRLKMERGVTSLTILQALWRRKVAIATFDSLRKKHGREMQILSAMEADRQLFFRERQIYVNQIENFYKSLKEEQEKTDQIQSRIANDQVMVRTLRRSLNNAELKNASPDNSEQLATEKWMAENQAKIESGVKATIGHCIHCLDRPESLVEKQNRSGIRKRIKARIPFVLKRADDRNIPMETKEAQQIAREEVIQIIAEEERIILDNQMKEDFTQRELRKKEEKIHAAVKEEEALSTAKIYAAQLAVKACRKWLARRELRRLCLEAYERLFDVQCHAFFYRNKLSGEASWTKPKAVGYFEIPAKDEWKLLRDAHNFPYYFNPFLMEMRWTPPCTEVMCCNTVPHTWWREYPIRKGACPNFSCFKDDDGKRYCKDCLV